MDLQQILQQDQPHVMLSQNLTQPEKVKDVSVEISSLYHQLNFEKCTLEMTEESIGLVLMETEESEKVVTLMFANVSSIGVQGMLFVRFLGDRVMVFLQGEENQQQQQEQHQGQQEHPMPQIFKLIKQSTQGGFNLNGNYTVSLGFSSVEVMKQTHELLVGYLHSDQNQDEDNFMMDEMISADQINQDGTINNFMNEGQGQDNQEDQEEEEDEQGNK